MTVPSTTVFAASGPPFNPDREDRYFAPEELAGAQRAFTFLVDFVAHDEDHAQVLAERYARGMNQLRLEIAPYTARIAAAGDLTTMRQVCCLARGPDPADLCTELAGHRCPHNGPGPTRVWTNQYLPTTPPAEHQHPPDTGRDSTGETPAGRP